MTALYGNALVTQDDNFTEKIKELQHAIQENTRKLEGAKQKRLRAEEEIIQCTRETERRVMMMMMVKSGVVDELQQLGHLLQEERHLSEQLNGQDSADRNQRKDLQERSERFANKTKSLTAEILEVKRCLAEAKARNMAAQALIHAPISISKRNQNK